MSKNTGGPAFPIYTEDMPVEGTPGMTLRDYFAAKAMAASIPVWLENEVEDVEWMAERAYSMADAMLAERGNQS